MKYTLLAILAYLMLGLPQSGAAQVPSTNIGIDSMMTIVIARINSYEPEILGQVTRAEYGSHFSVEDLATHASILKQGYGIYAFGLFGDDIPSWIMWWDATGYKIYGYDLDTKMLKDFLDYFKRNKIPDAKAFLYIKRLYDALVRMEYGEWEVPIKGTK